MSSVIDAAIACGDDGGLEALTMTKLAAKLGVGTMTLYGYVANKRQLIALIAERLFDDLDVPQTGTWEERISGYFRQFRAAALEHPFLSEVISVVQIDVPAVVADMEELLSAMRNAGLGAERAIRTFYAALSYTVGFVIWEIPRADSGAHAARMLSVLQSLDRNAFPRVTGPGHDVITSSASTQQFEWGLRALLRGIN